MNVNRNCILTFTFINANNLNLICFKYNTMDFLLTLEKMILALML
jgi:hypothetical protein